MTKITIKHARFLDPIFTYWVKGTRPGWKEPTHRVVLNRVKKYQKIWEKHGKRIINAMEKCTGMKFRRDEIRVYIVSGNPRPFSDPVVLTCRYNENEFLDILTHELIHCLFTDNRIPVKEVYALFPTCLQDDENDKVASAHIPVYAIIEHIFKNVLKIKYSIVKKYSNSKVNESYKEAAHMVDTFGYKGYLKTIRHELTKYIDTL
jgi:hypothetical protein